MNRVDAVVTALEALQADRYFNADIIATIWDSNFTEFDAVEDQVAPEILDEPNVVYLLENVVAACRSYVKEDNSSNIWLTLQADDSEVSFKATVSLLFFAIEKGLKVDSSGQQRCVGLAAGEVYLSMAAISGSHTYQMFNSFLYQRTVELLGRCASRITKQNLEEASSRKKNRKKNGRGAPSPDSLTEESLVDSGEELRLVKLSLRTATVALWRFLGHFSLVDSADNVVNTALALRRLLLVDGERAQIVDAADDERELLDRGQLAEIAFAGLHRLRKDRHDPTARITLEKAIFSRLLMFDDELKPIPSGTNIPARLVSIGSVAFKFVEQLIADDVNSVEGTNDTVITLCQNLCSFCPDRADYRETVSGHCAKIVSKLPEQHITRFLDWLGVFAANTRVSWRGIALDVGMALLAQQSTADDDTDAATEASDAVLSTLLRMLVQRCSDRAASVRTRALNIMAQLISISHERVEQLIDACLTANPVPSAGDDDDGMDDSVVVQPNAPPVSLVSVLIGRCCDWKVLVRKAAVRTLEALLMALPIGQWDDNCLSTLQQRSQDTALSVRKQVAESVTKLLLRYPDVDSLRRCWLSSILPMVTDRENTAQELGSTKMVEVVFSPFQTRTTEAAEALAWQLMLLIDQNVSNRRFLLRAIHLMEKDKKINSKMVPYLENQTHNRERCSAAWMLLAQLCSVFKVSPTTARVSYYLKTDMADRTLSWMAKIFAAGAAQMSVEEATDLLEDIQRKLTAFEVPPENISSFLYAVKMLCNRISANDHDGESTVYRWNQTLISNCEGFLSAIIFSSDHLPTDDAIIRRLFTIGEVAQFVPKLISARIFTIVEGFVVSEQLEVQLNQRPASAASVGTAARNATLAPTVRVHAVLTLGKLCLQDEERAKLCVPMLVRQLNSTRDASIRNNIVVTLSDLCIRCTSLVDRYIGTIALCLKDPSSLVRKQTLTLLTNLLKEDFLRWKGVLLYRFMSTLLDDDVGVREFSKFCLLNVLLRRYPEMFYNHFLECIFYFNAIDHQTWARSAGSGDAATATEASSAVRRDDDTHLFSLAGAHMAAQRYQLYQFMLRQFSDAQRFQTQARIASEVLGAFADESIVLNGQSEQLLSDALRILAMDEIKLTVLKKGGAIEDGDDELPAAAQELQTKHITDFAKTAMIQNVVPNIVSLKLFLQTRRSPLLRLFYEFLRGLMNDFRNEVQEVLASNKQMADEIEFDLQQFEKRQAEAERKRKQREADELRQPKAEPKNDDDDEATVANRENVVPSTPLPNGGRISMCELQDSVRRATIEAANTPKRRQPLESVSSDDGKTADGTTDGGTVDSDEPIPVKQCSQEGSSRDGSPIPAAPKEAAMDVDDDNEAAPEDTGTANGRLRLSVAVTNRQSMLRGSEIHRAEPKQRAISTPESSQLPDMTFRLGGNYTVLASPSLPPTTTLVPRRLEKRKLRSDSPSKSD